MGVMSQSGNRIEMIIDGKIDSDEMESLITEFMDKATDLESIQLLYIDRDFKLPTLGAMAVKLSHFGSLLKLTKKMQRVALLTDKNWLRKAARMENALIPWFEIKTFDTTAREQAEAWLMGDSEVK